MIQRIQKNRRCHAASYALSLALLGCDTNQPAADRSPVATPKLQLDEPRVVTPEVEGLVLAERYEDPDFLVEVFRSEACGDSSPLGPGRGKRRVELNVRVTSKTKREVPVSPLTFWLEDETKERHPATLAGCGPPLSSERLSAGSAARGNLSFDLPDHRIPQRLLYEPFVIGRARVSVPLALPTGS